MGTDVDVLDDVNPPKVEKPRPMVSAVTFMVWRDSLLLGFRTGLGGGWQCPGGKVDHGETTEEAAARETKEECGIEIDPKRLRWVGVQQHDGWVCFLYVHRFYGDKPPEPKIMEPDKHVLWHWQRWSEVMLVAETNPHDGLFPFLRNILLEPPKPSWERAKGTQAWCLHCHGRMPCACLTGANL